MYEVDRKDCILWKQAIRTGGYGAKWYNGKMEGAHRLAYCEAHGLSLNAIEGVLIRHKCDVRACINPAHLIPGTHQDNMRDMWERGRAVYNEGCKAPMTMEKAREVWIMRSEKYSQRQIAEALESTQQNVSLILNGKAWKGSKPESLQL